MRIYILTVGDYEANYNKIVTTDFSKVIDIAIEHYNYRGRKDPVIIWETLTSIEIWENEKQLLDYGEYQRDIINSYRPITREELIKDIERGLRERKN